MPERESLILVDGSSYLYRAFHALPELTNSAGEPTGAIHGVLNMLNKLVREEAPERFAIVFDAPGKTFRDELFEDYKANRPPMPDDLRAQVEPLLSAIEANGWPLLRVDGVEADDVIGTLAERAEKDGQRVVIVTGDKDMAQLVTDNVTLLDTMPRGPSRQPRPTDKDGVVERFGVRAEQIIDYLALVGDSSDNIPGVPKVGAKTAVALLEHFDHVDDILADVPAVEDLPIRGAKSLAARIEQNRDTLLLSRDLATIRTDVDVDTPALVPRSPDIDKLSELYGRFELRRLLESLDTAESPAAETADEERSYETILTEAQLDAWLGRIETANLAGFDTETTSINYMQAEIVGLSFATGDGDAAYLPLAHRYPGAPNQLERDETLARLRPWLEDEQQTKVGHHLKYDAHVLANHDIALAGMAYDSMLESYILDSTATRHDLDSVARKYLGVETIHYEDVAGKGAKQLRFDEVPLEQAAPYAAEDADVTLRLHNTLWPKIEANASLRKIYEDIERPLVGVLLRTEQNGVLVDAGLLKKLSSEFARKMGVVEQAAHDAAGHPFNLGSPKQLQEVLFKELELPVIRKTPKGQPSTAEDVLAELAPDYELPQLILDYRSLSKLKSTYTDKLPQQISPQTGRIHTSYHQAVAATGRLSSSDPNLQNIPIRTEEGRRIRQAFIAPDGCVLLAADYSQIELRIMAHISGDAGLVAAFAEDRDIHQSTAAEVFDLAVDEVTADQRRSAKAINFGLIYGMSAFGLARQLGIGRHEAQEYVDLYFDRYPGVKAYMDRTREQAREQGYVETVFGRRLYLPEINSRQAQRRQYAERSAINAPMQGTAADIIKRAMIGVDAWLRDADCGARLIMQVHDELVLEVPEQRLEEVRDSVIRLMSSAAALDVPLKVDAGSGSNWDEAH
ncbi:MAG: DNA polymerase I [Gammaproteobacteria bacterium]|nr:DNA polymerase I [Gammaproteobacteria bacterium]NND37759.1 DNA polymerase I [Gammaproteobacteria bacterium]